MKKLLVVSILIVIFGLSGWAFYFFIYSPDYIAHRTMEKLLVGDIGIFPNGFIYGFEKSDQFVVRYAVESNIPYDSKEVDYFRRLIFRIPSKPISYKLLKTSWDKEDYWRIEEKSFWKQFPGGFKTWPEAVDFYKKTYSGKKNLKYNPTCERVEYIDEKCLRKQFRYNVFTINNVYVMNLIFLKRDFNWELCMLNYD